MNQKILIIDGHPVYIHKVESFLEGLTFQKIFLTRSGREGIETAEEEMPDLVILSAMLPDMDSREVCRIIKEKSNAKIIVQIGLFTDEGDIARFREFGADAVLARKEKDLVPLQDAIEDLITA